MSKYSELVDLAVKNIELSYNYEERAFKLAQTFCGELTEYLCAPKNSIYLVQLNENLNCVNDSEDRLKVISKSDGKCYIGLKVHFQTGESRYFGGIVLEIGIHCGSSSSIFHAFGGTFKIDENSKNPYLTLCNYVYAAIEKEYKTEAGEPKDGIGFIR